MLCPLIWDIKRGTLERIGLLTCPHLHVHSFHDNPNRAKREAEESRILAYRTLTHFTLFEMFLSILMQVSFLERYIDACWMP